MRIEIRCACAIGSDTGMVLHSSSWFHSVHHGECAHLGGQTLPKGEGGALLLIQLLCDLSARGQGGIYVVRVRHSQRLVVLQQDACCVVQALVACRHRPTSESATGSAGCIH